MHAIPIFFGITLLAFLLMVASPGGPTAALALDPGLTSQDLKVAAARFGVNEPWYVQYVTWLFGNDWRYVDTDGDDIPDSPGTHYGILRGDFGNSYISNRPVLRAIMERAPATLELGLIALLFGLILGVPIGILAAVRRGGVFDNITRVLAVIINAVPIFWIGLILILVFGPTTLDILPMGGRCPDSLFGCPPLFQRLDHLILPVIVLGAGGMATYSRYLRASMLDVINQDYMRTARAKGLKDRRVWFGHGARNALIPLATAIGPSITGVLGGAIVTETIFSWPGLGLLGLQSVVGKDYPMVMGVTIIAATATIIGYLLSDVLYAIVDPRIRYH